MIAQLHGAIEFIGKDHLVVNIGAALGFLGDEFRVELPSREVVVSTVEFFVDVPLADNEAVEREPLFLKEEVD